MNSNQYKQLFWIVQFATIAIFLGRAYQYLYWDIPIRALLWDEGMMSGIVESLTSMSWEEYSTSIQVDETIEATKKAWGGFYIACALVALFARRLPRWVHKILLIGAAGLILLAALYCKEKFSSLGQFFEYTLQFSTPILLYYLLSKKEETQLVATFQSPRFHTVLKLLIALTFTCHGLYALGFYPVPGGFMNMTINILGVGDDTARTFLKGVGILDFVLSILIFVPHRGTVLAALAYAVFWGFGTTIARIWANFYWDFPMDSLHQWAHASLYRFPHFLIPLFLFLLIFWRKPE